MQKGELVIKCNYLCILQIWSDMDNIGSKSGRSYFINWAFFFFVNLGCYFQESLIFITWDVLMQYWYVRPGRCQFWLSNAVLAAFVIISVVPPLPPKSHWYRGIALIDHAHGNQKASEPPFPPWNGVTRYDADIERVLAQATFGLNGQLAIDELKHFCWFVWSIVAYCLKHCCLLLKALLLYCLHRVWHPHTMVSPTS